MKNRYERIHLREALKEAKYIVKYKECPIEKIQKIVELLKIADSSIKNLKIKKRK